MKKIILVIGMMLVIMLLLSGCVGTEENEEYTITGELFIFELSQDTGSNRLAFYLEDAVFSDETNDTFFIKNLTKLFPNAITVYGNYSSVSLNALGREQKDFVCYSTIFCFKIGEKYTFVLEKGDEMWEYYLAIITKVYDKYNNLIWENPCI